MLSLDQLSKRFGDVIALDDLSFEVTPGRILGFLGPNGAGKTTAMRAIFGLVTPDRGEVRWDGRPIEHADRLRFGYMPEERGLYPKMKIGEQLSYFGRLSGVLPKEAQAQADGWLMRMNLADRADSKLEELSHGNQQRVQLAVALVHEPIVAVLDEPFSGLDPIGMEALAGVLRELALRGAGIVFSSHQLDLVEDICQDVVIINDGRVVLAGEVRRLRNSASVRHLDIEVDGRPWTPDIPEVSVVDRNGQRRYLVDRSAPLGEILGMARAAGDITKFSFEPPTLSDLFREAVQG
jgi:ABC-2 type transport system ATP-binding protein